MRGWIALTLAGCGGGEGAGGTADAGADGGECPADLRAVGTACVPYFVDCGDDEVPTSGGGCASVGVPAECWPGWTRGDDGACAPILPAGDCPAGTMPIIGEPACAPVADCGEGTWGGLARGPDTVHVDASYGGAGSDGTEARPFRTIGEAVAVATAGGQVVVAAGEYEEDVLIDYRLRLEGRCPQMVTVRGVAPGNAAIVAAWDGVEVRGFRVTGPGYGLVAVDAADIVIEQVVIEDTGIAGLDVEIARDTVVRRVVVADATGAGIFVLGSSATIEDAWVRDTRTGAGGAGIGLFAQLDPLCDLAADAIVRRAVIERSAGPNLLVLGGAASGEELLLRESGVDGLPSGAAVQGEPGFPSSLAMARSLVDASRGAGVRVLGATATIEESTFRGSIPADESAYAPGIVVQALAETGEPSAATVSRTTVLASGAIGVHVGGATVTLEDLSVRDMSGRSKDDTPSGIALGVAPGADGKPSADPPTEATLSRVAVARSAGVGIGLLGAIASIEESAVRDTRALADGGFGYGLMIGADPEIGVRSSASLRGVLVAASRQAGLFVWSSDVVVEESVVRGTVPRASDGLAGDGLVALDDGAPVSVDLAGVLAEDNARAGFSFFGADGSLCASAAVGNTFAVALEDGADPEICADDEYRKNERNEVVVGKGLAAPAPVGR